MQLDTLSTPKNTDGMLSRHIVLSLKTVVRIVLVKINANSHLPNQTASTPKQYLRHATKEEIKAAPDGIGFHRFDSYCPIAIDCDFFGNCQAWLNMNIDKKGKESEKNENTMQW